MAKKLNLKDWSKEELFTIQKTYFQGGDIEGLARELSDYRKQEISPSDVVTIAEYLDKNPKPLKVSRIKGK